MLKKATVFRFTTPVKELFDHQSLESSLNQTPSKDCQPAQQKTQGWSAIDPSTGALVEQVGDALYIKMRVCEKKLSSGAVKSEVAKRVGRAEKSEGRKLKRAEKQEIEEQLRLELLPNTIQEERAVIGAIDLKESLLIVGESRKKSEEFCDLLRSCLGSLPVAALASENGTHSVFAHLISEELEIEGVELGDSATLINLETKEKAAFSKTDLHSDEVIAHVKSQMYPSKISMHFGGICAATVTDALDIAGLSISDATKEQQGYDDIEDQSALLRTELFLWSNCVSHVLSSLDPGLEIVPKRP
jgi:recombination associated protein RdgC